MAESEFLPHVLRFEPLVWLIASLPLAWLWWKMIGLMRLRRQVGMNDSQVAASVFINLVRDAQEHMLICDDGNDMKDSVYNVPEVVEAVESRLSENSDLALLCLFSSNDETAFTRRFDSHPQVRMKRGVKPRRDIHFKIIDNGRRGYVTRHPLGAYERRYCLYDCSRTSDEIRDAALGRHIRVMEGLFGKGLMVA